MTRSAAADAESTSGLLCRNRSMDSTQKLARFFKGIPQGISIALDGNNTLQGIEACVWGFFDCVYVS